MRVAVSKWDWLAIIILLFLLTKNQELLELLILVLK